MRSKDEMKEAASRLFSRVGYTEAEFVEADKRITIYAKSTYSGNIRVNIGRGKTIEQAILDAIMYVA